MPECAYCSVSAVYCMSKAKWQIRFYFPNNLRLQLSRAHQPGGVSKSCAHLQMRFIQKILDLAFPSESRGLIADLPSRISNIRTNRNRASKSLVLLSIELNETNK